MGKGYHFWGHLEIPLTIDPLFQVVRLKVPVLCQQLWIQDVNPEDSRIHLLLGGVGGRTSV